MSFLSPWYLLGLLGVAAPVVIHLVRRPKAEKVVFSTVRFLQKTPQKRIFFQRIQQWLLMMVRTAIVALLAIAFARPFFAQIVTAGAGKAPRSLVIVLDMSMSMQYGDTFEQAKNTALEILGSLQTGDEAGLVPFADRTGRVTELTTDLPKVLANLRDLGSAGFKSTHYLPALRMADQMLRAARHPLKTVYLISDFQRQAVEDFDHSWQLSPGIAFEAVPVGAEETTNLAVTEVKSPAHLERDREEHVIIGRVRSLGSRTPPEARISLVIDQKTVATQKVDLSGRSEVVATFRTRFSKRKVHRGALTVEDDSFAPDNTFFFTVKARRPLAGRVVLTGVLAASAGILGWRFFHVQRRMKSDARRMAHFIDEQIPQLEQRLITSLEFEGKKPAGDAATLVERLWQDTLARLRGVDVAPGSSIRGAWPAAAAALALLGGLFLAAGFFSEFSLAGRRIVMPWIGSVETADLPIGLRVTPGNIKIQRGGDVLLIARSANVVPKQAALYLQTAPDAWDRIPMRPEGDENTFVHFLAAVQKDVVYYVDIGVKRSERYTISVVDLPRVEQVALDYAYPEHTGLKNKTVRDAGDVIAPEGTRVTLHAAFNKAVERAAVSFGDGTTLDLAVNGAAASGSFIVAKDDTYTIDVVDNRQLANAEPYRYFIRSIPDTPPEIALIRPGRDRRVMSLEEVTIDADAQDDYGLTDFALTYSVAGGSDRKIDLLDHQGERPQDSVSGSTTLYLEDLGVNPGDFVFYYLTAQDNNRLKGPAEIVSDIYFLEVTPTDATFRRTPQQAGGGGGSRGGGRSTSALVENQKRIIAATWKLLKQRRETDPETLAENVATITESQRKVMQRAQMSLRRLSERLLFSDDSYKRAVDFLQQAVDHMAAAIEKLTSQQLKPALGPEQAALQAIMKAEAESRDTLIQIARNRGGGGGGAGQNDREREDLKELFEMEMGRLENRYEVPNNAAALRSNGESNDILEKLQRLARRQERLNKAQKDLARRQDRMDDAQKKRRLEVLRREQEKLRRAAEDLSRRMSRLARRDGLRQGAGRQQLAEAVRRMQEAEGDLRAQNPGTAVTKGQQAANQLRDQEREMRSERRSTVSDLVKALRRKGRSLQQQERRITQKLQDLETELGSTSPAGETRAARLTDELLADKERMQQELTEAESMLKSIAGRGQTDQPEIADRAKQTLRTLGSEGIEKQIEQSREMLESGWLGLALDTEKKIERSIERVGRQLQDLDRPEAPSREEQIRQAAAAASGLRWELEQLQKEVAALKQDSAGRQQRMSGVRAPVEGLQTRPGDEGGGAAARMQDHLMRSRRYARELAKPWARGQSWGGDARSIQRELTRKEIEDFLAQPDLWKRLLEPVRELESTLQAQAGGDQQKKKIFAAPEETVPSSYQDTVAEYYRELSRTDRNNHR